MRKAEYLCIISSLVRLAAISVGWTEDRYRQIEEIQIEIQIDRGIILHGRENIQ